MNDCTKSCPLGQEATFCINLVEEGNYLEALKIIINKNPLPFITGTLCLLNSVNLFEQKFPEDSVSLCNATLLAAEHAFDELMESLDTPSIIRKEKVAILGGGPAGLSTAYFLAKEGVDVTLFEKRKALGGMVHHLIPSFNVYKSTIHKDIRLIDRSGVKFKLAHEITSLATLKSKGFTYIVIATGAWKPTFFIKNHLPLDTEENLIYNQTTLEITPNIFVAGDILNGSGTIIQSILDAKKVANEILHRLNILPTPYSI